LEYISPVVEKIDQTHLLFFRKYLTLLPQTVIKVIQIKINNMKTIKQLSVLVLLSMISSYGWAQSAQPETTKTNGIYKAFEMSVSEGLNLQAAAKIGIRPVYGIFGIGTQFLSEDYKWAFGLGIGTHLIKQEKQSMNLEYMIYHVNQNEIWTDNFNNLQQIKLLYSKRIGEKISIFGGPSLNLNIAENKQSFGHTFESTFAPYDIYSNVGDNHTAKGWIGFTLGIRFDK
jgi:hypothetical protein